MKQAVNLGAEILKPRALCEMRNDKIIERVGEADQRAREDARHQLVNHYLTECLKRRAAEVERSVVKTVVHAADTRHDIEYHKGNTEANMREQHGGKSHFKVKYYAEKSKQQH